MKRLYILIGMALFLFACKKDEPTLSTSVSGKVFNPSTNSYYSGLKISLSRKIPYSTNDESVMTTYCDALGNYTFQFDAFQDDLYFIKIHTDIDTSFQFVYAYQSDGGPYYCEKNVELGRENHIDLNPASAAHMLFHFDVNYGADSVKLILDHAFLNEYDYESNPLAAGNTVNYPCLFVPSGNWTITYRIWNNGIQADSIKNIWLNPRELTKDTLRI